RHGRLVRGVWSARDGRGCPLSCAHGVVGETRAGHFLSLARERNAFILAWDAGLISPADVLALVELEIERRAARPALVQRLAAVVAAVTARLARSAPVGV
ncbi:MAG: hypothetical protein NZ518_09495, partial [Dehalococcoidia bacterium]|nr:hypothetical protein [Dehalococcoidia bacterium]